MNNAVRYKQCLIPSFKNVSSHYSTSRFILTLYLLSGYDLSADCHIDLHTRGTVMFKYTEPVTLVVGRKRGGPRCSVVGVHYFL